MGAERIGESLAVSAQGGSATQPLVSVIIDNYNYGHLVAQAIDSALAQTYPNIEIIVVDDGSTDNSREVIASYGDRVVPVFQQNAGQCAAFNAGFAASRGDIIAYLDSDDTWTPTKLERVVAIFERYPHVAWVGHKLAVTDARLTPVGATFPAALSEGEVGPDPHLYLERVVTVPTSAICLRRELAEKVFPVPYEASGGVWWTSIDVYTITVAGIEGTRGYHIDECLGCYRRHSGQMFPDGRKVRSMLEREIVVSEAVEALWRQRRGSRMSATSINKHRLIIAALEGRRRFAPMRWRMLAGGLAQAGRIAVSQPRLGVRQAAALLFAFGFPHRWVTRLMRRYGMQGSAV